MDECCISLGLPKAFRPLVHLYTLRILVKLGGHRHVLDDRRVSNPDVFHDLGIGLPSPELPYRPDLLLIKLRRQLLDLDRRAPTAPSDATLTGNLHWLSGTMELTQIEADIVQFLAVVHHAPLVRSLLEKFTSLRTHEAHLVLATVLALPLEAVSQVLSHTSKLVRSGLVWSDLSNPWGFTQKLGLLEGVADQLTLPQSDPFHLFLSNFRRSVPATLGLQDFSYLGADLQVLVHYLADSIQNRRKGVNILIEGPPGTGKTELVRALARELGSPLFEITSENRSGDPHNGRTRSGAFQLAHPSQGASRGRAWDPLYSPVSNSSQRCSPLANLRCASKSNGS